MIVLQQLLASRRFWLAVLDVIQIVVLHYAGLPADLWGSIHVVLMVVIAAYTIDDTVQSLRRPPQ